MIKTLVQLASNISAAMVGGGVFLFSLFAFQFGLALSFFVGFSGYVIAGIWIFPSSQVLIPKKHKDPFTPLFREGTRQLNTMRALSDTISNADVREVTSYICDIALKILETIKNSPAEANTVQQFSAYYLDPTIKILRKYLEISAHNASSSKLWGTLERVELILDSVQVAFEKQLSHLLSDGILAPDTEIASLEETIDIIEI